MSVLYFFKPVQCFLTGILQPLMGTSSLAWGAFFCLIHKPMLLFIFSSTQKIKIKSFSLKAVETNQQVRGSRNNYENDRSKSLSQLQ